MLGNILIDKFQCYLLLRYNTPHYVNELKNHLKATLGRHFAKNSYSVWASQNGWRLHLWFTPTRYFNSILEQQKYTDTNIDMPEEMQLRDLFQELFNNEELRKLLPTCRVTILDLTKNFLMSLKVYYYLEALRKFKYNYGYKAKSTNSGHYSKTITISTTARKTLKRDTIGDRELKCYDKIAELRTRHLTEVVLKKPLSKEELSIPKIKQNYVESTNTLNLQGLNILRLEWHYKHGKKLCEISKFLGFENNSHLYLQDFLNLLEAGMLYENLDKFFKEQTLRIFKPSANKKKRKQNIYLKILTDYNEAFEKIPSLEYVFSEIGMSKGYINMQKYLQEAVTNKYIIEILSNTE